jgi:hypothetical protein
MTGALTTIRTNPVTLNLFQGPFRLLDRNVVGQQGRAAGPAEAATELAAGWTLKRVQGDETFFGGGAA